jgi:hypothetical protein
LSLSFEVVIVLDVVVLYATNADITTSTMAYDEHPATITNVGTTHQGHDVDDAIHNHLTQYSFQYSNANEDDDDDNDDQKKQEGIYLMNNDEYDAAMMK